MKQGATHDAHAVAKVLGWQVGTVYVNRRLSLRKIAEGRELDPTDLPIGRQTPDGLRWSDAELATLARAKKDSHRRGGRPRREKT